MWYLTGILFLLLLPILIKLGILYIAYIDWALRFPIICSIRLFGKKQPQGIKKAPIGFSLSDTEPTGALAKKKETK